MIERALNYIFKKLQRTSLQYYHKSLRKKYNLHNTFKFNGIDILFYGNGVIEIGENTYVGSYSSLQAAQGHAIKIGKNCRISHNVRMYTTSTDPDQDFNNFFDLKKKEGDIIIGDAVWIDVNVFIGPGIKLGNNSIIGANSVVSKDVSDNSIVAGTPAKFLRFKAGI